MASLIALETLSIKMKLSDYIFSITLYYEINIKLNIDIFYKILNRIK